MQQGHRGVASAPRVRNTALHSAIVYALWAGLAAMPAMAQEQPPQPAEGTPAAADAQAPPQDTGKVTRHPGAIQYTIQTKRDASVVSDALSAKDIGDLPALSIGEAIETITGATTHREKGGASEIAVRGLGPFLGSASFNGREATNGSVIGKRFSAS